MWVLHSGRKIATIFKHDILFQCILMQFHLNDVENVFNRIEVTAFCKDRKFWLYVIIMSRTRFRVNLHHIVAWMPRNLLLETGAIFEVLATATWLESSTTVRKRTLHGWSTNVIPSHSCFSNILWCVKGQQKYHTFLFGSLINILHSFFYGADLWRLHLSQELLQS